MTAYTEHTCIKNKEKIEKATTLLESRFGHGAEGPQLTPVALHFLFPCPKP